MVRSMDATASRNSTISEFSEKKIASGSRLKNGACRLSLALRGEESERTSVQTMATQNLLTCRQQDLLFASATALVYQRGRKTLFYEGQDASFIYFIDSGVIQLSRRAQNSRRQILALRVSGDILGLSENKRYPNTAETVGAAKVYRIPWQRVQQAMLIEPELSLHLFMKASSDCHEAERRIMSLGQQNPCQRLISFILDLRCVPELFDEEKSLLNLPMNRSDLADYLGIVTKSSERSFAKLEGDGVIRRITARTVEILDLKALQRLQYEQRRDH